MIEIYIDGSYTVNKPDRYSYGMVVLQNGVEVHTEGKMFINPENAKMRNVAGEVEGAKAAVNYCLKNNIKEADIYYDYKGIECWATGAWKAKKKETQAYVSLIKSANLNLHFHKVKSHTGVEFNERVDQLAKDALEI